MTLTDLSAVAWPGDPTPIDDLLADTCDTVVNAIINTPRSLQAEVGPSEIGVDCLRKLAHKLLRTAPCNDRKVPWRPFVGTAMHDKLADIFTAANAGQYPVRWLPELKVSVGEIWRNGQQVEITGHSDLMALAGQVVIDWKCIGRASLTRYRRQGPSRQYREQAHLYGRGFVRRGLPVRHVAIIFLPVAGEFDERVIWHEPYDEQIALDALNRLQAVQTTVDTLGTAAPALFPPAADHCTHCPFWQPGATDLTVACPGVEPAPEPAAPTGSVFR